MIQPKTIGNLQRSAITGSNMDVNGHLTKIRRKTMALIKLIPEKSLGPTEGQSDSAPCFSQREKNNLIYDIIILKSIPVTLQLTFGICDD